LTLHTKIKYLEFPPSMPFQQQKTTFRSRFEK